MPSYLCNLQSIKVLTFCFFRMWWNDDQKFYLTIYLIKSLCSAHPNTITENTPFWQIDISANFQKLMVAFVFYLKCVHNSTASSSMRAWFFFVRHISTFKFLPRFFLYNANFGFSHWLTIFLNKPNLLLYDSNDFWSFLVNKSK